jgi:hypothetical protein
MTSNYPAIVSSNPILPNYSNTTSTTTNYTTNSMASFPPHDDSHNLGSDKDISVNAIGTISTNSNYRCGKCGQRKSNHVCQVAVVVSVDATTHVQGPIIHEVAQQPFSVERFLTVSTSRPRVVLIRM